jgi:hypothetical protein
MQRLKRSDTDIQIEGPAVTEVQKLFLETWSKQKKPTLAAHNYLPDQKEYGKALVSIVGSTPGTDNRITFITNKDRWGERPLSQKIKEAAAHLFFRWL